MTGRLRDGISEAWGRLADRLRPRPRRAAAVKGCVRNVIVVKPGDRAFKEAVFILRDDYFSSPGLSRSSLLSQARDAARRYTDTVAPARGFPLGAVVVSVLVTSGVFVLLIVAGVI